MSVLNKNEAILLGDLNPKRRIQKDKIHGKSIISSSRKPFYIQVVLWKEQSDMLCHIGEPEETGIQAVTLFDTYVENPITGENSPTSYKIAELHFVSNMWNINVVAHEVFHAIVHRMRIMYPGAALLPYEQYADAEEEIAYELGNWVQKVFTWLFNNDPCNINGDFLYTAIAGDKTKYLSTPTLPDWVTNIREDISPTQKQMVLNFNKEQP